MALEDVGSIEAFFRGGSGAWTEAADHGTFVMCQSVAIFVIFAGESFCVIDASGDRTFLRPL